MSGRCLMTVFVLLSASLAHADEPAGGASVERVSPGIQVGELQQLQAELEDAYREIDRLQSQFSVQQASWLQEQAADSSGKSSGGEDGGGLAQKSQNPVSDLVSLPLQNNFDFGFDPGNRTRYLGNLQPVIPVKLNEDWNLVQRFIVPIVNAPIGGDLRSDGLGDSLLQLFFSPRNAEGIIWGVGPNLLCPTATDRTLGFQEWGVGVNGVVLAMEGPVVTGILLSQTWSVEGNTKPFLAQPFFNYNLPAGWFISASADCNADWEQPENRRWTIPAGAGVGRVFSVFGQTMNVSTRFAPFLQAPPGGPDWQFRVQVTYLFPK